jgi:Uma2 family endonuclease
MTPDVLQQEEKKTYTREEYLALDLDAGEGEGVKYEYDGTHVYMMAGASMPHNQVASNVNTALSTRLAEEECRVLQSDLRVRLPDGRYTYPDVVALCAAPELTEERPPSLLNPELIVEVASDSTGERDRTWKLERYLQIESLREYWILESDAPRLQQYVRDEPRGEWVVRTLSGEEAELRCEAFALDVPLAALYRLVFEDDTEEAASEK